MIGKHLLEAPPDHVNPLESEDALGRLVDLSEHRRTVEQEVSGGEKIADLVERDRARLCGPGRERSVGIGVGAGVRMHRRILDGYVCIAQGLCFRYVHEYVQYN